MDLDLSVSDLLLPPYPYADTIHETVVEGEGQDYLIRFRLPRGADQEAVAGMALDDVEAAANILMQRCVEQVTVKGNGGQPLQRMPAVVVQKLPGVMSELDPQAEIRLSLTCPACGVPSDVVLDTANYLFDEIAAKRDDLYREVHFLAFHYHWSEADILGLTKQKRRHYIGLLAEAIKERRAK
jgi:hypothetical protein